MEERIQDIRSRLIIPKGGNANGNVIAQVDFFSTHECIISIGNWVDTDGDPPLRQKYKSPFYREPGRSCLGKVQPHWH